MSEPARIGDEDRDVVFRWKTTPSELRNIASLLESQKSVCVNWYVAQVVFVNKTYKEPAQADK